MGALKTNVIFVLWSFVFRFAFFQFSSKALFGKF